MSTCDHICRECGGVMNCQHCKPRRLPKDRARIAELEALLREADLFTIWEMHMPNGQEFQQRIEKALGIGKND